MTALSLVGVVGMILFAVLVSAARNEHGMSGIGAMVAAIAVAIAAAFDAIVTTALVYLVRTRRQVIAVHLVVAVVSFAVVFGMR